jgi:hypothetical protein
MRAAIALTTRSGEPDFGLLWLQRQTNRLATEVQLVPE